MSQLSSQQLIDVVITSREEQGNGVVILELTNLNGTDLPQVTAGAHIDVHIADDLVRQYSLCHQPRLSNHYRIGVLNDPNSRGGSVKIFEDFTLNTALKISAPRNHFPLISGAGRTILAGGGIGITPMIAMAYQLKANHQDFELHYCSRSIGTGAFEAELRQQFAEQVVFHYDDGDDAQRFNPQAVFSPCASDCHIYVCGPSGFMDWVIKQASEAGYPSQQIHFEYFSAEVDTTGDAFEVYCAVSDIIVQVKEQQPIFKALAEAGVKVSVSCEEGICGSCITDVLEGEPDHRDKFLTDEEKSDNDQMALCCSRAKSKRLVLDI